MENSVDPHHVEWLHGRFMNYHRGLENTEQAQVLTKKHLKVGFDAFEFGIIKRRVLEGGTEEDDDWKVGHPLVFPVTLLVGGGGLHQFQIRVPIDDTHTWHIWYTTYKTEAEHPPQSVVPHYEVPLFDDKGNRILDFVDGQDIAAWAGQGTIADRSQENLAASDVGVALLRRMLKEQLDRVEQGLDPIGTVRDPQHNRCIELPMEKNKYGAGESFRNELMAFQAIRHSPIREELRRLFAEGARRKAAREGAQAAPA
jgi:5,5'-dehydrodivanillate O-demethylase